MIKSKPPFQNIVNFTTFTDLKSTLFLPIMTGLFISFGLSTKSPLTFFSASAGAVGTDKALALTLAASGAAAAFIRFCLLFLRYSWSRRSSSACFFSARPNGFIRAGCRKRKKKNYEIRIKIIIPITSILSRQY